MVGRVLFVFLCSLGGLLFFGWERTVDAGAWCFSSWHGRNLSRSDFSYTIYC